MTANKMPEMPEAVWIALDTPGADYEVSFVRTEGEAVEFDDNGTPAPRTNLYTADQMRAMYLAGIEAAKACVPTLVEVFGMEINSTEDVAYALDLVRSNLTALEQEAKK